ncbi:MAG TPA: caspase family protein [Thermoanaerobaculia bacterium]|nr:caspase family protein [Thermoanaerobaculia bacterium]
MLVLLLLAPVAPVVMVWKRGVTTEPVRFVNLDAPFDPAASAGIFIGVQQYPDPSFTRVQFAVDDAIDMAWTFVLQCRTVPAKRTILALEGKPSKAISRTRLQQLKVAGVTVLGASRSEILESLGRYENVAGLFVVSFAGHGFSTAGTPYLATSTSRLEDQKTWLSSLEMVDRVAQRAGRSLVLIDACRERVLAGTRAIVPAAPAALIPPMKKTHGQVVLYAAPAGGWAYDDMTRKNGVFTAAVIDGLQCGNRPRTITVDQLTNFVAKEVGTWVRKHKQPGAKSVIQSNVDDRAKKMALVVCGKPAPAVPNPDAVTVDGTKLIYLDKTKQQLRSVEVGAPITHAEVADLEADLANEVIAAVGGKLIIFEADGKERKRVDLNATSLHPRTSSSRVTSFRIARLFFGDPTKQIVAAAVGASGSRFAIINHDGTIRETHWYDGIVRNFLLSEMKQSTFLQKIVFWGSHRVAMLDPKNFRKTEWDVELPNRITRIAVGDHDADKHFELAISKSDGRTAYLGFDGHWLNLK